MQQKSKKLEIAALVVGLLLVGVGLAAWLSQYWTFDFDFEIGDSKTAVAKYESTKLAVAGCQSDNDCALGLECFHGECSYPCRVPLVCPIGMVCGAAEYCEQEPEVCDDGIDNNENGKVDDGCVCIPGTFITCKTGLPGVCSAGEMICLPDGRVSGICEPPALPFPEICGNHLDENCDGVVDENCLWCDENPELCAKAIVASIKFVLGL